MRPELFLRAGLSLTPPWEEDSHLIGQESSPYGGELERG